ncbi:hypothetical protein C1I59_17665 [Paenibacillus polymyxa]|uniref:hypothetical protein n=1 Tax=Paenibacillus polymyxa TaxID=1406 RepID=UPI0010BE7B19|nr:hypothetical protein [Paenibacillus polymyxa]TKH35677.1 hypothetical protein C1I59_17665 [Paenibacillus polymyxa]
MRKESKAIVIDASVARAVGVKEHPTSSKSRHFLEEFLKTTHFFVMTPEIKREWDKHQSIIALTFRRRMIATKRMKAFSEEVVIKDDLRTTIDALKGSERKRKAIEKDALLIEAALVSDNTIVSCDDKVRAYLCSSSALIGYIRDTVWVNPINENEEPINWLRNGAPNEHEKTLGFIYREVALNEKID